MSEKIIYPLGKGVKTPKGRTVWIQVGDPDFPGAGFVCVEESRKPIWAGVMHEEHMWTMGGEDFDDLVDEYPIGSVLARKFGEEGLSIGQD